MAAHNRLAGKKPTPLSPKPNGPLNPLSSLSEPTKGAKKPGTEDKKKAAMLAAFKGKH